MNYNYEDFCLYEQLEAILEYEEKDVKRIEDFFSKANGDMSKVIALAGQMARAITNPEKAFNRAEAALAVMGTKSGDKNPVADIFYKRCKELGCTKTNTDLEASIKKSPSSSPTPSAPTNVNPPAPRVPKPPKPPKEEVIEPEPEKTANPPASTLPPDKRFKPEKNPYENAISYSHGVEIQPVGNVNLRSTSEIEKLGTGTIEVWEILTLMHRTAGDYAIIVVKDLNPTCAIGTKAHFSNARKEVFYAKMVDYTNIEDARGLIELYGNTFKYYTYK